jgi:hypothetical protein
VKTGPDQWESTLAADGALLRGLAGLHHCYGHDSAAESLLDLALWLDPADKTASAMMTRVQMRQKRDLGAKNYMDTAGEAGR